MKTIIEHIKTSAALVAFGVAALGFSLAGCANMYDESGNLTAETVEDFNAGREAASVIVSTVAPEFNWLVGAGSAVAGGVLTLVGKTFYNRKKKGAING